MSNFICYFMYNKYNSNSSSNGTWKVANTIASLNVLPLTKSYSHRTTDDFRSHSRNYMYALVVILNKWKIGVKNKWYDGGSTINKTGTLLCYS